MRRNRVTVAVDPERGRCSTASASPTTVRAARCPRALEWSRARLDSVGSVTYECPRCKTENDEEFYGPCTSCRSALRALFQQEGRVIHLAEYEPKMNVTPNAVALKDD